MLVRCPDTRVSEVSVTSSSGVREGSSEQLAVRGRCCRKRVQERTQDPRVSKRGQCAPESSQEHPSAPKTGAWTCPASTQRAVPAGRAAALKSEPCLPPVNERSVRRKKEEGACAASACFALVMLSGQQSSRESNGGNCPHPTAPLSTLPSAREYNTKAASSLTLVIWRRPRSWKNVRKDTRLVEDIRGTAWVVQIFSVGQPDTREVCGCCRRRRLAAFSRTVSR